MPKKVSQVGSISQLKIAIYEIFCSQGFLGIDRPVFIEVYEDEEHDYIVKIYPDGLLDIRPRLACDWA